VEDFIKPWGSKTMKKLIKLSLAFIFLQCILAGCTNAQTVRTVNLSTRKAVLEWLGKQKKEKFSDDNVCIGRLKESKQVIVIGFLRTDYGCRFDGAFVYSAYIEDSADLSHIALHALGWKKANQKQRERLAKLWVEKGLLAFSTVLYVKGDDFVPGRGITYRGGSKPNFPEFHPPQASSMENGEVVVTLWTSVMKKEKRVHHHEYRFTKDGHLRED
jgi:hypothetical protein